MHTYIHVYIHTYIHIHIYLLTYMDTYIHTKNITQLNGLFHPEEVAMKPGLTVSLRVVLRIVPVNCHHCHFSVGMVGNGQVRSVRMLPALLGFREPTEPSIRFAVSLSSCGLYTTLRMGPAPKWAMAGGAIPREAVFGCKTHQLVAYSSASNPFSDNFSRYLV